MRILARKDPFDPLWRDLEPQVAPGHLGDASALARLTDGADLVVHAAGRVKARSRTDFDAVNVAGAARLAEAARTAPHVILVSSLTAREPHLSHYSASKAAGEAAMRTVLGSRLTIARPCAIYGPGDRELLPVFQAAAASPLLPVLSATGRVAMVHVSDAARQIAGLAQGSGAPTGEVYEICDARAEGYLWSELMTAAAEAVGRSPRLVPAPALLVRGLGRINDLAALAGGEPMLSSAKTRELLHPDWSVAEGRRPPHAPTPQYDLRKGFAATVAWYRTAGWMTG